MLVTKKLIDFETNEKVFQIDYKENLAVAFKMIEEIAMDLEDDSDISEEMSKVDQMEQDLLHMIEFHTFNASEGYSLAKMLQEVRQQRRVIKNRHEERRKAKEFLANNYKSKFKAPLTNAVRNFETLDDRQSARKYKLRALPQLQGFNKLINESKISK